MTFYVNVYPPLVEGDLPILRRFWTKKEAVQNQLDGCLYTIKLTV